MVLVGFIKRVTDHYTITNRRLHIKRGIVSREIQETRLERVQNVNYRQSVYQRMLQVGDVDFDTAAGDDYNFVFAGVADPAEVVEQVDQATHAAAPRRASATSPRAPTQAPASPAELGDVGRGAASAAAPSRPAAPRSASARSVRSQVKSWSVAAEVAVGGGLLEDRPVQVEVADDRARAQVELLARRSAISSASGSLPVPKVSTISETGWATPIA